MKPKIFSVTDHDINPHFIDADALYVLEKLHQAGFTAYLVGGGVRDLLLKRTPKDFDISTSALPQDIKKIFRKQCLLIGRRFLLAHIRFGHKIIEVSTFRSGENEGDLIVHDNQWGTPEQDVLRRDFTINGLFYDPTTHTVIDYVGGWEDLHQGILRTIGDPLIRFRQDPVRMIRLLKFRARFGFKILPEVRAALLQCRQEILKSSSARVVEEILRMLESGASAPFFNLLLESGLLHYIYPELVAYLQGPLGKETFAYLSCADKINQGLNKNPLDRSILGSCLFFPALKQKIKENYTEQQQVPHLGHVIVQTSELLNTFHLKAFARFPKKISTLMHTILSFQYRLTPLSGKRHFSPRILRSKDFIHSLQFFKIRASIDQDLVETYNSWKNAYLHQKRQTEHKGHPYHQPV